MLSSQETAADQCGRHHGHGHGLHVDTGRFGNGREHCMQGGHGLSCVYVWLS